MIHYIRLFNIRTINNKIYKVNYKCYNMQRFQPYCPLAIVSLESYLLVDLEVYISDYFAWLIYYQKLESKKLDMN